MITHTHLPKLQESRIYDDPYLSRLRRREAAMEVFLVHHWLYISQSVHVFVGHEPGPYVGAPWLELVQWLSETQQRPGPYAMRRCRELAHAFVEP